jgi:hypothetical protein
VTVGERALLQMAEVVPWERVFLGVGIVAMALFCLVQIAALLLLAPAVRTAVRDLFGQEE